MKVGELSNDELLARLDALCAGNKRILAELLAHLGEVEARGVYRDIGYDSMFAYCLERLGISEPSTWRRLHAARMCRRIPTLLGRIERGEVHLSTLAMIRPKVPDARCEELLAKIAGKSKRQAEVILAAADPKPDVETTMRKLPERKAQVHVADSVMHGDRDADACGDVANAEGAAARPSAIANAEGAALSAPVLAAAPRVRIEALSKDSHKVVFTMSTKTQERLLKARDLMRHSNPSGDLAVVLERAIDELLERLEKRTRGATSRPRTKAPGPVRAGYVPRATRYEVFMRDGNQCTFTTDDGKRCASRTLLELDHIQPRGRGGGEDAANLRVRCRAHNQLYAEQVYGARHVARKIQNRRRKEAG